MPQILGKWRGGGGWNEQIAKQSKNNSFLGRYFNERSNCFFLGTNVRVEGGLIYRRSVTLLINKIIEKLQNINIDIFEYYSSAGDGDLPWLYQREWRPGPRHPARSLVARPVLVPAAILLLFLQVADVITAQPSPAHGRILQEFHFLSWGSISSKLESEIHNSVMPLTRSPSWRVAGCLSDWAEQFICMNFDGNVSGGGRSDNGRTVNNFSVKFSSKYLNYQCWAGLGWAGSLIRVTIGRTETWSSICNRASNEGSQRFHNHGECPYYY